MNSVRRSLNGAECSVFGVLFGCSVDLNSVRRAFFGRTTVYGEDGRRGEKIEKLVKNEMKKREMKTDTSL